MTINAALAALAIARRNFERASASVDRTARARAARRLAEARDKVREAMAQTLCTK